MTLPTFLLVGAMKAGTSSLHAHLGAHPDVFVPEEKEPDFFCGGDAAAGGLDRYRALFAPGADAIARGEASTRYSKDPTFPGVPERVVAAVPDVRIVYVLRHPVERIRSHHRHAVAEWGHPARLADAIAAHRGEYLVPTRYGHQLACWLDHVPQERVHVLTSEDLAAEPDRTLDAVFSFLGVDPARRPAAPVRRRNQGGDHRAESGALTALRTSAPYRLLRSRLPKRLRHAAWRAASSPAPQADPDLPAELETAILDDLAPDLHRLATLLPDFHCWGLRDRTPTPPMGPEPA